MSCFLRAENIASVKKSHPFEILKSITAWLWLRNLRIYNRFGYSILKIEKERGTMDGKTENKNTIS